MAYKIQLDEAMDYYTPDIGVVSGPVCCGVCGEEMKNLGQSRGPRGYAESMLMHSRGETDTGTPHDVFECRHIKASWHRQAKALVKEAQKTASGRLSKLLLNEARDVIVNKTATKKISPLHHLGL